MKAVFVAKTGEAGGGAIGSTAPRPICLTKITSDLFPSSEGGKKRPSARGGASENKKTENQNENDSSDDEESNQAGE